MRKNWLTTTAGIMAALGGVPVLVAQSSLTHIPAWWANAQFYFILCGIAGVALLGYSSKGQDEHSTAAQVAVSTIHAAVDAEDSGKTQNGIPEQGQSWSGKSQNKSAGA
jgi:hypothetical protein